MDGLANPINVTRIFCLRVDSTCQMSSAEFDPKNGMLYFGSPAVYEIKTWSARVTAIREHPCGTALMTIDVDAKAVTVTSAPHADFRVLQQGTIQRLDVSGRIPCRVENPPGQGQQGTRPRLRTGAAACPTGQGNIEMNPQFIHTIAIPRKKNCSFLCIAARLGALVTLLVLARSPVAHAAETTVVVFDPNRGYAVEGCRWFPEFCVGDPTGGLYDFADRLTTQLAIDARCKGIQLVRWDQEKDLFETLRGPHWMLVVYYNPWAKETQRWALWQVPGTATLGGDGNERQIAEGVCSIVTERGAKLK